MSISILAFLTLALTISNSANTFCFDKAAYANDFLKAQQNQNAYCVDFIKNLEEKNELDDHTNITVFTHGLGSSYLDWLPLSSESYTHVDYESFSMPFNYAKVVDNNGGNFTPYHFNNGDKIPVYVFSAGYNNDTTIEQFVFHDHSNIGLDSYFELEEVDSIKTEDIINKTISLIYNDPSGSDYETKEVVDRFESSLCNVLCRIYNAQLCKLGQINLVGHSRGGLTNTIFSTRHPKLVRNMVSLGTPYHGSVWANAYLYLNELAWYTSSDETEKEMLKKEIDVTREMLSYENTVKYSTLFNSTCEDINSYAIGFDMTPSALLLAVASALNDDKSLNDLIDDFSKEWVMSLPNIVSNSLQAKLDSYGNLASLVGKIILDCISDPMNSFVDNSESANTVSRNYIQFAATNLRFALDIAIGALRLFDATNIYYNLLRNIIIGLNYDQETRDKIYGTFIDCLDSFWAILNNDVIGHTNISSDVCVSTYSQEGSNDYVFDSTDVITLSPVDTPELFDVSHCARPESIAVPHNFETKNDLAVEKTLDFIVFHDGVSLCDINNFDSSKNHRVAVFAKDEIQNPCIMKACDIYPNNYGYSDYYPYESEFNNSELVTKSFTVDDINVTTTALRTGFIQSEKIVMSPDRTNAGSAFIEYRFSKPIGGITVDLSLWSDKENCNQNGQLLYLISYEETINEIKTRNIISKPLPGSKLYFSDVGNSLTGMSGQIFYNLDYVTNYPYIAPRYILPTDHMVIPGQPLEKVPNYTLIGLERGYRFDLSTLSTNRNSPDTFTIAFDRPTTVFGFYTGVKTITSQTRNKGRICIGDITFYTFNGDNAGVITSQL